MQPERVVEKRPIIIVYFPIIFLLTLLVGGILLPKGARSLIIQMMIFSIFGMGYDICLGFTNQTSLGHSFFFGAGAYGAIFSILYLRAGIFSSLSSSVFAGFVLAIIMGTICVRLSESYFVIVTAIFSAIFHLLAMDTTWLTGGDDGLSITLPPVSLGWVKFSLYNPYINYYFVLVFLALSYFFLRRIIRAPIGKIFVAIRENQIRAHFLGYNIFRYKLIAFVLSGMFGTLSGALYALTLRYASADFFGIYWSILPIVWCLIGGSGTLTGSWIGVVILSLFQYYVSAWWSHYLLLFGVVILFIQKVSRKGILGYLVK